MDHENKFFLPFQIRWLKDQSRLKIVEKSRQVGMTFTDAYDSVKKVMNRGARLDVWVSSRDEEQAKLYLRDCATWAAFFNLRAVDIGQVVIDRENKISAYVLEFKSGRRIYSLSSNPNALAGKRGHVKLDEFALHQDQRQLYRVAKPVTQWGGQLCIISTHRGANTVFNQMIRQIREAGNPMGWSLHSVPLQKAVDEGLAERINQKTGGELERKLLGRPLAFVPRPSRLNWQPPPDPELREAWVKNVRGECLDEEQWLQEYCCVPADDASAFITYEMLTACEEPDLRLITIEQLMNFPSADHAGSPLPFRMGEGSGVRASDNQLSTIHHQLFLGLDVARKRDLCVLDVGEKIGDVVWDRARIELQGASFSEIEAELYRLLKLRELKRACIDATGMGAQLAERARQKFGWKVEPVTFTAAIKEELAFGLRADFEDRRIRIVRDEKLAADLRSVKKQLTSSGNLRFEGHSEDSHCDRFWAKALRQHAARQKPRVSAAVG